MKRYRKVDDIERQLRKLRVPDGFLFRHVEQLDKARAKRRARKARAEASKPIILPTKDRYPNE